MPRTNRRVAGLFYLFTRSAACTDEGWTDPVQLATCTGASNDADSVSQMPAVISVDCVCLGAASGRGRHPPHDAQRRNDRACVRAGVHAGVCVCGRAFGVSLRRRKSDMRLFETGPLAVVCARGESLCSLLRDCGITVCVVTRAVAS